MAVRAGAIVKSVVIVGGMIVAVATVQNWDRGALRFELPSVLNSIFGPDLSCTSKPNRESVLALIKKQPFDILARDRSLSNNSTYVRYVLFGGMAKALVAGKQDKSIDDVNNALLDKFFAEADIVIDPMIIKLETSRQSQCVTYVHMIEKSSGQRVGNIKVDVTLTNEDGDIAINIQW